MQNFREGCVRFGASVVPDASVQSKWILRLVVHVLNKKIMVN